MIKFLILLLLFAAPALAQYPPPNVSDVTIDSQASVVRSESFCYTTTAHSFVNLWTLATVYNSDIVAVPNLSLIRYITIQNMTLSATPLSTGILAVKVGDGIFDSLIAGLNVVSGASMQINVRRPKNGAVVGGVFPAGPIPIRLLSTIPVKFCVTAWW